MSALLASQCSPEFLDPYDPKKLLGRDHKLLEKFRKREEPITGMPAESCNTNLFFGFFFDGTKNNYKQAEAGKNHSNVARLYDCYPGLSVPGVLPESAEWKQKPMPSNFFKVYVPGVASPFDQVGDTGAGTDLKFGGAAGALAERRIIWALLQAINNVHRYLLKTPLVSQEEADGLVRKIVLHKHARALMVGDGRARNSDDRGLQGARRSFEEILRLRCSRRTFEDFRLAPSRGRIQSFFKSVRAGYRAAV